MFVVKGTCRVAPPGAGATVKAPADATRDIKALPGPDVKPAVNQFNLGTRCSSRPPDDMVLYQEPALRRRRGPAILGPPQPCG